MRIQEALSKCCEGLNGIKDFASSAASKIGKNVSTAGSFLSDGIAKVAAFVRPHFENLKSFAQNNQQSLLVAGVAVVIGAIATAVMTHIFQRGTGASESASTSGISAISATVTV